ncbi:MAG TPA: hypothetical protein VFA94_12590 [Acidimicrobiales bacterium]|nr:hypothetical protein [Acidimicrobiales bacterium]
MAEYKFFSAEWCEAALEVCNANEKVYQGFKDPLNFSHKMEFACLDRDLATHMEWKEGRVASWGPPVYDESDLWLIIKADVATWREVAEGGSEGGKMLMAGKIKFVKGPMAAAIENGGAFNNFLRSWGAVATDWDV